MAKKICNYMDCERKHHAKGFCKKHYKRLLKGNIQKKDKVLVDKRDSYYKKEYGISAQEYDAMLKEQNHVCAICGKPETMKHQNGKIRNLAVDHCHKTGQVRGLLCSAHNRGIGYFGDDVELLKKAIEYLEKQKRASAPSEEEISNSTEAHKQHPMSF